MMPFFIPPLCDWLLWGNPHFITAIAVTSISLCLFLQIGRGKVPTLWRDAGIVVLLVLLQSYLFLSQPVRAVIASPMLAFFGLAAVLGAESSRERLRKLVVGTMLGAILAVCFARLYVRPFLLRPDYVLLGRSGRFSGAVEATIVHHVGSPQLMVR